MVHNEQKKLVNWSGSMKISAQSFRQTEDFFIDSIRDCATLKLTHYNYGLLPIGGNSNSPENIQISQHITGYIDILVTRCNAITSSGIRINFNPKDESGALFKSFSPQKEGCENVGLWYVAISVDPFKRVATGELDPNETPPRHPNAESLYTLQIIPEGEIQTSQLCNHFIAIGRFRKETDRYVVDNNYIPPCTTISAHTDLISYHNRFVKMLGDLERSSSNIISKIHARSNKTSLAENINAICRDILRYIAVNSFNCRNKGIYDSPIEIINVLSGLAHIIYVNLKFINGPQKEELLKYLYEWSDVTPGSFEGLISGMIELKYEHDKIRQSMIEVENFIMTMSDLWDRMSGLEYIGQHKESIVVSQQKSVESEKINSWTIVD